MHGWQPYRNGSTTVYAVQFWPSDRIWPECVIAWGVNEFRNNDMSWGYVETAGGRIHVNAGDWIVKRDLEVLGPGEFHKQYKALKE